MIINNSDLYFDKCKEAPSITYLKRLHPLLLVDEFNPQVRLLVDILFLELIYHACLVQELTITTQHLKRTEENYYTHLTSTLT